MRLVFLYGPPGVGKLTVAKELGAITGYRVFHNHLTIDMVESLFPRTSPDFRPVLRKYRLFLIEEAAKRGVDFILTFAYRNEASTNEWTQELINCVEKHGGKMLFVQLLCSQEELERRVKHPTRKKFGKMSTVAKLKEHMEAYDLLSPVPHGKSLTIDNTKLDPRVVAGMIKKHFNL